MQPMLVGTTSIEKSEQLADYLVTKGWTMLDVSQPGALETLYKAAREATPSKLFTVLNARFHEQEAYIVAEAGVPGAVTVATNMAGRGTDIQLGGNVEMRVEKELGEIEPGPERDAARGGDSRRGGRLPGQGQGSRRPLHRRHRAPREPPHRQPAARSRGSPGRRRPLQVLPVA